MAMLRACMGTTRWIVLVTPDKRFLKFGEITPIVAISTNIFIYGLYSMRQQRLALDRSRSLIFIEI